MKKIMFILVPYTLLILVLSLPKNSFSQSIGIGTSTPNASSILDIRSTNKGLLIPRMITPIIMSISNPEKGLMVYDSVKNQLLVNMGSTTLPNWQTIVFKSGWSLNGNSGTNTASDFIGTTDSIPFNIRVYNQTAGRIDVSPTANTFFGYRAGNFNNGIENTGIGQQSLYSNTTGRFNTAIGSNTLYSNTMGSSNAAIGNYALYSNTTGDFNTAIGDIALANNSTGHNNSAIGAQALANNSTGSFNNANGNFALLLNVSGSNNTATGYAALQNNSNGSNNSAYGNNTLLQNTSGVNNTAIGYHAMQGSTTGDDNTAVGNYALFSNGAGIENTAIGANALLNNSGNGNTANGNQALFYNTSGYGNTASGSKALANNTTGLLNTAAGINSMYLNTTGQYNTAIGSFSLYGTVSAFYNTALGYNAGDSYNNGYNNVFVGASSDVSANQLFNVIAIGQGTIVAASSTARFGNASTVSYGGWAGWSNVSDGRYKKNIKENVPGLDFINKLRPVTYNLAATELDAFLHKNGKDKLTDEAREVHAKALIDKERIVYSGFVAQEVEAISKQLGFNFSGVDAPKNENDTYGLRYAEFVVPLVKAVQELSKQNEELLKRIEKLESLLLRKNN